VVHGLIGMDELSITGNSIYWEVKNGECCACRREISPESLGFIKAPLKTILGGTPEKNAQIIRSILSGEKGPGETWS
jgi:anthranilate phosphoribosyltransferase